MNNMCPGKAKRTIFYEYPIPIYWSENDCSDCTTASDDLYSLPITSVGLGEQGLVVIARTITYFVPGTSYLPTYNLVVCR